MKYVIIIILLIYIIFEYSRSNDAIKELEVNSEYVDIQDDSGFKVIEKSSFQRFILTIIEKIKHKSFDFEIKATPKQILHINSILEDLKTDLNTYVNKHSGNAEFMEIFNKYNKPVLFDRKPIHEDDADPQEQAEDDPLRINDDIMLFKKNVAEVCQTTIAIATAISKSKKKYRFDISLLGNLSKELTMDKSNGELSDAPEYFTEETRIKTRTVLQKAPASLANTKLMRNQEIIQ